MKVLAFDGTTEEWHESIKAIAELADRIEVALKQIDEMHSLMLIQSSIESVNDLACLYQRRINEKPKG